MAELEVTQIKNKNWARRHKRQKGLLNPRPWGFASRGRGSRVGKNSNPEQAAQEIRAMLKEMK